MNPLVKQGLWRWLPGFVSLSSCLPVRHPTPGFVYLLLLLLFSHSVVSDSLWPHGLQNASLPCPSLSPGVLLKLMSIESVMLANHLKLCRLLLLPPSTFPSIRVFSNESVLSIRWLKYWSFSFSICPSNEYSGMISLRTDILLFGVWIQYWGFDAFLQIRGNWL